MKNKLITGLLPLSVSLIMACSGNHSAKGGEDTAKAQHEAPSNIDTSQTTTATGDASAVDNSASGGTKTARPDSLRVDSTKK